MYTSYTMFTKKDRRHSGWITPSSTIKDKKKNIINECLEPLPFYDDWVERRDGFRDWMNDRTKIKPKLFETSEWFYNYFDIKKLNKKLKRLLKRRKARKNSPRNSN